MSHIVPRWRYTYSTLSPWATSQLGSMAGQSRPNWPLGRSARRLYCRKYVYGQIGPFGFYANDQINADFIAPTVLAPRGHFLLRRMSDLTGPDIRKRPAASELSHIFFISSSDSDFTRQLRLHTEEKHLRSLARAFPCVFQSDNNSEKRRFPSVRPLVGRPVGRSVGGQLFSASPS